MTTKTREKFGRLKEMELNARTDKDRSKIQKEFDRLADEDPEGFEDAFLESARLTLHKAKKLRIKDQMSEMSEIVSMSYIAKTYFNKTKSWLSQRINELNVNGKPAQFTPEELEILNAAFHDISRKTGAFRITN